VRQEDGVAPGEAQEMPNEGAGASRSDGAGCGESGALPLRRSGDPNMGSFADATILKTFGEVPSNLDELEIWMLILS
jgi:hypothetical protein